MNKTPAKRILLVLTLIILILGSYILAEILVQTAVNEALAGAIGFKIITVIAFILLVSMFIFNVLILKLKTPKNSVKILSIINIITLSVSSVFLILILAGVLPYYEEVFMQSKCCALVGEVPSIFSRSVCIMLFIAIDLSIVIKIIKREARRGR